MIATDRAFTILLYLTTLVVSACSIVYELLIAHTLSQLAMNAVVWYSVTIGLFLLGMGLGALLYHKYFSRSNALITFTFVELALAIVGGLAVPCIFLAHSLYTFCYYWALLHYPALVFFSLTFCLSILIGILTGMELPILMRVAREYESSERSNQKILGFDYMGSLVGALVFSVLLLPFFSVSSIGVGVALLNASIACVVWFISRRKHRAISTLSTTVALGVLLLFLVLIDRRAEQFFLKRYYSYRILSQEGSRFFSTGSALPAIHRIRSPYQMIDFFQDPEGDGSDSFIEVVSSKFVTEPNFPRNHLLFLNRDWQFHSNHEEVYHEYFAHFPIMQSGAVPERVLLLGGGDGLLARELLRYQEIRSITHVDLDPVLVEYARENPIMRRMNADSLHDTRVSTIFTDAFQYVRNSEELFDAIYIDLPTPNDYNVAKLYSSEFYSHVRSHLKPKGFMVFDAVGISAFALPDERGREVMLPVNSWQRYYHTLRAAGFTRIQPYISFLGWQQDAALEKAKQVLSDSEAHIRVQRYVHHRRNGFIIAGMPGLLLGNSYKAPPGPALYSLTAERYPLAFYYQFGESEEIDHNLVNSIFKPTFPTVPIWTAKLPF